METTTVRGRDAEKGKASAGELMLERRADGRLWATRGGTERAVWVRRCFPWSEPARFVSLRDDDQQEFALVRDPADLDAASRGVLEEALVAAGFVFQITRVTAIEEEVDIRHWRVETRQGTRSFQTRLDTWPRVLQHGGLLVPTRHVAARAAARWPARPRRGGGSLSSPRSGCARPAEPGAGVGVRGLVLSAAGAKDLLFVAHRRLLTDARDDTCRAPRSRALRAGPP